MREILFRLKGQTGFERRWIEWYYSKEPSDEDFMSQNISETCEVIGNIYDNPELLKKKEALPLMTYKEAIEQLKWYFEPDDGGAADGTTRMAYQIAIRVLELAAAREESK